MKKLNLEKIKPKQIVKALELVPADVHFARLNLDGNIFAEILFHIIKPKEDETFSYRNWITEECIFYQYRDNLKEVLEGDYSTESLVDAFESYYQVICAKYKKSYRKYFTEIQEDIFMDAFLAELNCFVFAFFPEELDISDFSEEFYKEYLDERLDEVYQEEDEDDTPYLLGSYWHEDPEEDCSDDDSYDSMDYWEDEY